MSAFFTALVPVILIVALGQFLVRRGFVPAEAFRALDRLSFLVLLPALIIRALANAQFDGAPWLMIAALMAAQVLLGALGLLAHAWPGMRRPEVGTIVQ